MSSSRFQDTVRTIIDANYDLKVASPEFCISLLAYPTERTFTKLYRKIQTRDRRWIRDFIRADGLYAIIIAIEDIFRRKNSSLMNSILLLKCINCIKELMNSICGMQAVINLASEKKDCIQTLAKSKLFLLCRL